MNNLIIEYEKENKSIPALTPYFVHEYLYEIGQQWSGKGVVVELGSWLGATAMPLLKGLIRAGYDRSFYCFDRWQATIEQVRHAKNQGLNIKQNQDLLPVFLKNVNKYYLDIFAVKGEIIKNLKWELGPIEICILDAPKRNPVFSHVINELLPWWIPETTIIGFLDYYFYKKKEGKVRQALKAPLRFINQHKDNFKLLKNWPEKCSCAFFKYVKKIDY